MLKKLLLRYGLAATAGVALAVMGPAVQVDLGHDENEAHATTAVEVEASSLPKALSDDVEIQAWPVPTRRSYYITASCSQHASAIRRGAAAWQGLTEGGGTPVECRNSYITDCGGGGRIVGCNWGRGQRIALYMGGVGDDALLAAHEFGHNWYGHSTYRCAGWGSPQEVMAPAICTLRGSPDARQ